MKIKIPGFKGLEKAITNSGLNNLCIATFELQFK